MASIDFSPLYRSSIGFDRMASLLDSALRADQVSAGYPPYNIEVTGEVIEAYVTSLMMYEGKVAIEVTLKIDGKEIFTRKYSGTDESLNFAATAKSYGITLTRSLQQALKEAAHDIDRAVSKN